MGKISWGGFRSELKGNRFSMMEMGVLWRSFKLRKINRKDFNNKKKLLSIVSKDLPKVKRRRSYQRKSPDGNVKRRKSFVMFTPQERKNITSDYNKLVNSNKKCTDHTRTEIVKAARGMYVYPDQSNKRFSNEHMCSTIEEAKKEKQRPIVHEDSITAWGNQAAEEYGLEIKDIARMKPGQKMKVILLDRNVGDYMHDNSGKSIGKTFDPKEKGFSYGVYTHKSGITGILHHIDVGVVDKDFTWEVNLQAVNGGIFWGPLSEGVSWKKLDPSIKVGWRGPAIDLKNANKLPKRFRHYDTWWDDYLPFRTHNFSKKNKGKVKKNKGNTPKSKARNKVLCPRIWEKTVEKHGLTIKDVLNFKSGYVVQLLFLHRNVFDGSVDPKINKPKYDYTPSYFFRHEKWYYIHSEGLTGTIYKENKKDGRKFEWELNISKYNVKNLAWYPLKNGRMKVLKNKKWNTFPKNTQVGWRGSAVLWKDLKDFPKIRYEKEGCLVCGKEAYRCD